MHEMAYVRDVVDAVNATAREAGAKRVGAVYLTIGMSRDIVEDYFQGLFTWLARGTAAEGAEVVIRRLPLTVRCNQCGTVFPLNSRDSSTWACPCCHAARDYKLHTGMEFRIDKILVAVDAETGRARDAEHGQSAEAPARDELLAESA